jgi:hypothetical protein
MIAAIQKYFTSVPPMFIDGTLYALIAWFTFNQAYFGGDEAAKYIEPETKFWLNWVIGSSASLFAAIKMFRSTSYSEHLAEVKKEGKSGT